MMAIMTDGNKEELPKEFIEGGRTGRRNAMPDILHADANVTTADLPDRLQQLATSGAQTASSPSDSDSSNDSENVLRKFLNSKLSSRRNALLASRDQATAVNSTAFSSSVSEAILDDFMHSGCCQRRNALPCITPKPPGDNTETESTVMLGEQSMKPSCSQDCLRKFLTSSCSKRRCAVPCIRFRGISESTSVSSCDLRADEDAKIEHFEVPRFEVPAHGIQVIQLDQSRLMEMINEPNPQPGTSSEAAADEPKADDRRDQQSGS